MPSDSGEKSEIARREEETLSFWKERDIFKKSIEKPAPKGEFVFYEGPPTANGLPGIHHLESRAFKDAIPRYRTMRGYRVRRKAGWDTHGIPVELEVEKKLGFKSKKDIETYGIAEFNKKCKESVLQYIEQWKSFTERIAFWVDHDDTYFTFDNGYIESVWNILKNAHERGLLYKDYKVVPWCPRCGTALSSHEVAQGYEDDVPDPSVYVKFKVREADEYFLAWTTTPWTLPGNLALTVGSDIAYVKVEHEGERLWVARDRLSAVLPEANVLEEQKGRVLIGKEYEPLFPYYAQGLPDAQSETLKNAYKVYAADFVSTEDGTGIVHTAVMYGADDFELGTKVGLPKHHLVGEDGTFLPVAGELAGKFVKDADADIIADLDDRGLLFRRETIKHTYPFCWRCKTPLLYYARDSWYIAMSKIKNELIRENKTIHWEPEHVREGRFGEWLRELKDWAISRSRFWGTPLPFWECGKCRKFVVLGSAAELKEKAGKAPEDLHRPHIDELTFACPCGGTMRRVPEVLDVWFDSGAMPFAQAHHPFEKQDIAYPADFICEAIDQTRGWFYTLHAIGGIMERGKAFKNVICLGHVLDAKGKKMSKSLGNVVEPERMLAAYGADALRYFMYTVNAPGDSKNFDERIVGDIVKKNIGRLGNVLAFYQLYADGTTRDWKSENLLDRWIVARLGELIRDATDGFEEYKLDSATRPLALFIDDLSVWYIRRSRDRFKKEGGDKKAALATLRYVLHTLSRVMAPTMPFFAEHLFQVVLEEKDEESVHLATWPESRATLNFIQNMFGLGGEDKKLLAGMRAAREMVTRALEARQKAGIKVRQPLRQLTVNSEQLTDALKIIVRDEINVKDVVVSNAIPAGTIELDTDITPELREEGVVRDTIRLVQDARKAANMRPGEHGSVSIAVSSEDRPTIERNLAHIQKQTNTAIALS